MTSPTAVATPTPIPVRQLLPWAVFALLVSAILVYFVGLEGGLSSVTNGTWVHEFTHDGRHLLGFPCH